MSNLKESSKALVLFSGGQDSTTCLAVALRDFPNQVEAIAFDYLQRHQIELKKAAIIAKIAGVPLKIMRLPFINKITENSLTRKTIEIRASEQTQELPNTFVEGRNHIFLSVAAIYAKTRGIKNIYAGVCQTDFSGYPDCRDVFIKSLNQTLNLAMDYDFKIITPLMWLTKARTIKLMAELGHLDWYRYTYTCYEGKELACGVCPSCKLRLKGFFEAGIPDPIKYA